MGFPSGDSCRVAMAFTLTNIAKNAHGILYIFEIVYLGGEEDKRVITHAWHTLMTTTATKQLSYSIAYCIIYGSRDSSQATHSYSSLRIK